MALKIGSTLVIALGGNALLVRGQKADGAAQRANIARALELRVIDEASGAAQSAHMQRGPQAPLAAGTMDFVKVTFGE